MDLKTITFNLFAVISWPLGLWLCYSGKVSWWVFLLFVLMSIEANITWKIRE